jgi:hypothetical protein
MPSPKDKNGGIPSVYEEITPSTRHYQLLGIMSAYAELGITDILVRLDIALRKRRTRMFNATRISTPSSESEGWKIHIV